MWFIARILLIYIFGEEKVITDLISKLFLGTAKSKLTKGEVNKLIRTVKKLNPKAFARLPKSVRNSILQSINVYGVLPLNKISKELSNSSLEKYFTTTYGTDMDTGETFIHSNPAKAIRAKLNTTFNPLNKYNNFANYVKNKNNQFYRDELNKHFAEHNEAYENKSFVEQIEKNALINDYWDGESDGIIGAYYVPYSENSPTGDIVIITARGVGIYTFPNFQGQVFHSWAITENFGRNFWKYYFWPVYKPSK